MVKPSPDLKASQRPTVSSETNPLPVQERTEEDASPANLREALDRMTQAFKPFTMKLLGGERSSVRLEQQEQIEAHKQALAALAVQTTAGVDSARLDFLERAAKRSPTGVSFDWIPSVEGERSGYRFMRHHYIGGAKADIRGAIDAELASLPPASGRDQ